MEKDMRRLSMREAEILCWRRFKNFRRQFPYHEYMIRFGIYFIFLIVIFYPYLIFFISRTIEIEMGVLGDVYGGLNTFFSALAFSGLIVTIILQRKDLKLQRKELIESRSELKGQKDALVQSARLAAAQVNLMEKQTNLIEKQLDSEVKIIKIREFYIMIDHFLKLNNSNGIMKKFLPSNDIKSLDDFLKKMKINYEKEIESPHSNLHNLLSMIKYILVYINDNIYLKEEEKKIYLEGFINHVPKSICFLLMIHGSIKKDFELNTLILKYNILRSIYMSDIVKNNKYLSNVEIEKFIDELLEDFCQQMKSLNDNPCVITRDFPLKKNGYCVISCEGKFTIIKFSQEGFSCNDSYVMFLKDILTFRIFCLNLSIPEEDLVEFKYDSSSRDVILFSIKIPKYSRYYK